MCLTTCLECACCCGFALCCACCRGCASKAGAPEKTHGRLSYVLFQMFWIGITYFTMWIMTWFTDSFWLSWTGFQCPSASGGGDNCWGTSLLIRTSFALLVCQTICFLICLSKSEGAAKFNDGCWGIKFLIVAAMLVGSLWIQNDPFY